MKLNYRRAGGRDLYADKVECKCPDPRWADTDVAHLFKRKIQLSGYADDNFFNNVNKEPRHSQCECGRKFQYQWFESHVEFNWEPSNDPKQT